ncbi:MAG: hypothetical protein U0325_34610 [Polyangiales bacterium]
MQGLTWQEATRRFQRRLLEETLDGCQGNVSEAARRRRPRALAPARAAARMDSAADADDALAPGARAGPG